MWALNGAASVLASFAAIILSMETSIGTTALLGAACYGIAALSLAEKSAPSAQLADVEIDQKIPSHLAIR